MLEVSRLTAAARELSSHGSRPLAAPRDEVIKVSPNSGRRRGRVSVKGGPDDLQDKHLMRSSFLILFIPLLTSCSVDRSGAPDQVSSCQVLVNVAGVDRPYERLLRLDAKPSYVTCPVSPKRSGETTIYVFQDNVGVCSGRGLRGLPVKEVTPISIREAEDGAMGCNAAFRGTAVRSKEMGAHVYAWQFQPTNGREAYKLVGDAHAGLTPTIIKSGLPFVRLESFEDLIGSK
jgi:hypothetical protein